MWMDGWMVATQAAVVERISFAMINQVRRGEFLKDKKIFRHFYQLMFDDDDAGKEPGRKK